MKLRQAPLWGIGLSVIAFSLSLPVLAQGFEPKPVAKAAQPTEAVPKARTTYYGMYLRGQKIGYSRIIQDRSATYAGKPAVRTESKTEATLNVLGTVTQINEQSVSFDNPATGLPLAVESRTESGGKVSIVKATFTERSVTYSVDVQGAKRSDTLTLQPGENFLADVSNGVSKVPPPGTKLKGKVFLPEPTMLRLMDVEVEFGGLESVNVAGQVVQGTKVSIKNPIAPSTLWVDADGTPLRTDAALGLQSFRQSKELALAPIDKAADLMALVGIRPEGPRLENPRRLTFARYEFTRVTRPLPASDNVQQIQETGSGDEGKTLLLTVATGPLPEGPTVPLFQKPEDAPENLRPFLKSTLYVQSDLPIFVEQAKKILGGETDCARVARILADYVHKHMRPDPTISNIRIASDIWKDPRGVCRDYTLLYTTLARAAGLPTKQCLGLTYLNGVFLGHAWPEVWVGKDARGMDRWVALEPTLGTPFADATHIKLAEGEMTDFFAVAADFERYKIRVLEAK